MALINLHYGSRVSVGESRFKERKYSKCMREILINWAAWFSQTWLEDWFPSALTRFLLISVTPSKQCIWKGGRGVEAVSMLSLPNCVFFFFFFLINLSWRNC